VPPLSKLDSTLTPNDATSQIVGVISSWIDMCSPDPLIADLSRQVFMLEVAYAAFCGIGYLLVPGPKLHHGGIHSEGVVYFARAIQDALSLGPYIQFHTWFRMVDTPELEVDTMGDLAPLAREEYLVPDDGVSPKIDLFGTWDAWDLVRKTCKYHSRLFVGKYRSLYSVENSVTKFDFSSCHAQTAASLTCAVSLAFRASSPTHH
jgi:protein arginine N-methyltransferase 5